MGLNGIMTKQFANRFSGSGSLVKLWLGVCSVILLWPGLLSAQDIKIDPGTGGAVIISGEVRVPDLSGTGTNSDGVCYDATTGQLTNRSLRDRTVEWP